MSLHVLLHIAAWTQGQPLLPALGNKGKILTRPQSTIDFPLVPFAVLIRKKFLNIQSDEKVLIKVPNNIKN